MAQTPGLGVLVTESILKRMTALNCAVYFPKHFVSD